MTDGFLTRWSRRKLEGGAVQPAPAAGDAERASAAELQQQEISDDAITPEEVAALPAISDITLDTDITAFLRKGVPSALRNAALQRLWVLDPDIRDFVGEARDYAWDWNTPGGVPVSGPLEAGTDIPAMLRRVFGEEIEPVRENENVIAEAGPAPQPPVQQQPAPTRPAAIAPATEAAESGILSDNAESNEEVASVRRHGGALPA